MANGTSGVVTWNYDETTKVLTISGTGAMNDYSTASSVPWFDYTPSATRIVIEEGITHIGKYSFYAFNRNAVCTDLRIPNTVTTIGTHAFYSLRKVTTPIKLKNIISIGEYAFNGCSVIPEIYLGPSLISVGRDAFSACMEVTKVTFLGPKPTLARGSFSLGLSQTPDNVTHPATAVVYSPGWASDSVFTSGSTGVRGQYTTFTYELLKGSTIPVNVKGIWKGSTPFAKVKGVWKEVTAWCKDNGVWHKIGGDYEGYTGLAVFFDANGGDGYMSPILAESSATIPSNAFTRDKYRFSGWNTSPDGSGTTYSVGQTITITSNVTLYAIWVAVFTVSFNANGGSGSIAAIQTEGALTIPSNAFTLSGYVFNGWNTSPDGTGTAYSEGQSTTVTSDLTLYAVWIRQYTVSFNANGGTGTVASIVTTSATATVPANAFSRSGHRFDRWSTTADGSGTTYSVGQTITLTGDITLYAIWIQQFTIRYSKKWQGDNMLWHPPESNTGPVGGGYLDLKVGGTTVAGLNDKFTVHTDSYYSPEYSITVDAGTPLSVTSKQKVGSNSNVIKRNDSNVSGPATSVSYDLPGGVQCDLNILMTWRISYSWLGKTTGSWWIIDIWDR